MTGLWGARRFAWEDRFGVGGFWVSGLWLEKQVPRLHCASLGMTGLWVRCASLGMTGLGCAQLRSGGQGWGGWVLGEGLWRFGERPWWENGGWSGDDAGFE